MVIRFLHFISLVFAATLFFASPVEAKWWRASGPAVNVVIDISSQSMSVKVNGWPYGRWKVSTARSGYYTPRGVSGFSGRRRSIIRGNMTIRRCQIPCFSKVATPSMAVLREIPWAACIAWLCAASSLPRREAVQPGSEVWLKLDTDHDHKLIAWEDQCGHSRDCAGADRALILVKKPHEFPTSQMCRAVTIWL